MNRNIVIVGAMIVALGAAAGFGGAAGLAASGQSPAEDQFMTGAEPIEEAEYDRLPKLGKFRAFLPKKVDLTSNFPKPGSQGAQPNCTAWATTYAARSFLYGQAVGRQPTTLDETMSPAYVYNRLRRPGSKCDQAIRIVDALNLLKSEGSVSLADFPDDLENCHVPAPTALRDKAGRYRLGDWRAIERDGKRTSLRAPVVIDDIKGALYRGEPVVFAMPANPDFKALRDDTVYRRDTAAGTNFHAMTVIGYDEDRQAFRIINSWGDWWGDKGYAWIDYSTFRLLVSEAYALQNLVSTAALLKPAPALPPRDALQTLVATLPCGTAQVDSSGKRLVVSGFGGSTEALDSLKKAALAVDPRVDWRVTHRPWPQCEAEMTLSTPLALAGVRLIAQAANGKRRQGDPIQMAAGDFFGLSAEVAVDKPYLSLIYLQADGSAVELFRGLVPTAKNGKRVVSIGLAGSAETRFRVSAPFGDEMVIALASNGPIFGEEMADYATERQFLSALRAKLSALPKNAVSGAVLRIKTRS